MAEQKPNGDSMTKMMFNQLDEKIVEQERRSAKIFDDIWKAINGIRKSVEDIRNRPAVWMMALVALLTGIIGWLINAAF